MPFRYANPVVKDPQIITDIRKAAPKAIDKEGRELMQFSGIWVSSSFERFYELVYSMDPEDFIVALRVGDGVFVSRKSRMIRHAMRAWRRKIVTGYYCFIDPTTQVVYQ